MQGITGLRVYQLAWGMLFGLAVLSLIGLALVGQVPEAVAGWAVRPLAATGVGRTVRRRWGEGGAGVRTGGRCGAICGTVGVRSYYAWLVGQWLTQVKELLARLESGGRLPVETRVALGDVIALAAEAGGTALPWLLRGELGLWGQWQLVTDDQVRCPEGGSAQVGRKSAQPRWKQYCDAAGQLQQVAVYRSYCRNPPCDQGRCTNLPAGLVPYSPYRTEVHLLALPM
jgi:hypothetical protein